MWGEKDVHISTWDLKRQYKVCNFGLKAEIFWSLKWRREICRPLKQTCQLPMCVLQPSHYFTKRVSTTEERYVQTLSDCISITHNCRHQRIKILIISLYIYESFVVCPLVQYMTDTGSTIILLGKTNFHLLKTIFLHSRHNWWRIFRSNKQKSLYACKSITLKVMSFILLCWWYGSRCWTFLPRSHNFFFCLVRKTAEQQSSKLVSDMKVETIR